MVFLFTSSFSALPGPPLRSFSIFPSLRYGFPSLESYALAYCRRTDFAARLKRKTRRRRCRLRACVALVASHPALERSKLATRRLANAVGRIPRRHITIHNFRLCEYRAESDYTCEWLTKEMNLSDMRGIDLSLTYWGSPWIAHTILSFQIGDNDHVAMSIETRKAVGPGVFGASGIFPPLHSGLRNFR